MEEVVIDPASMVDSAYLPELPADIWFLILTKLSLKEARDFTRVFRNRRISWAFFVSEQHTGKKFKSDECNALLKQVNRLMFKPKEEKNEILDRIIDKVSTLSKIFEWEQGWSLTLRNDVNAVIDWGLGGRVSIQDYEDFVWFLKTVRSGYIRTDKEEEKFNNDVSSKANSQQCGMICSAPMAGLGLSVGTIMRLTTDDYRAHIASYVLLGVGGISLVAAIAPFLNIVPRMRNFALSCCGFFRRSGVTEQTPLLQMERGEVQNNLITPVPTSHTPQPTISRQLG
jgi:hypothetical protein